MTTMDKIVSASEALFDRHGFTATGMDKLTRGAGVSSRTLYKHVGSKSALIARVLDERDRRFARRVEEDTIEALFDALEEWGRVEGRRGCLFLRALSETGGDTPEIKAAVLAHKTRMAERVARLVEQETGRCDAALTEQIIVLFEGAAAAAAYRGEQAIGAARQAAAALVAGARS
ncbi:MULTISPECIES: TetR/AcrR family transcriptional regulator [unclassified Halomonas]|uniref:TetR/AcrR family transcriptional regulator n=1 Tax=unclassified Halomonas TaxID=2609666 RepID=UPI00209CB2F1|nr:MULTISPECIES: TetR/AcrR family transcriptional regulator [unclassified Halomonas]MCP1313659.1 TetR/AcrR family transcriptional regulator [Halomonas sp. 707D7]MCP1326901.1 TetR/AcrR family transcriptional regulator [Halomonas sp. 707D4]